MTRASVEDFPSVLEELPCPLCGSQTSHSRHSVRDRLNIPLYLETDRPQDLTYKIVACSSCGLLYLNPRPKAEELARFYHAENYDPHSGKGKSWIGKLFHLARFFTLQWKYSAISAGMKKGSLLDIGCGTGEFLVHLKSRGWDVTGIEQDERAASIARANDVDVLVGDPAELLPGEQQYDLVTMWHSLEHLPRLDASVEKIIDVIKSDGRLCIAVPNPNSYDAMRFGARWAAWDAPRHLYHFRPEDVKRLILPHALELLAMKQMPLDAFYHSLLSSTCWEDSKSNIAVLAGSLFTGLISFLKGINSTRGSGILYIFSK